MRISDRSSDVCSSDLTHVVHRKRRNAVPYRPSLRFLLLTEISRARLHRLIKSDCPFAGHQAINLFLHQGSRCTLTPGVCVFDPHSPQPRRERISEEYLARLRLHRSEEPTSELQSLMRTSYTVFSL